MSSKLLLLLLFMLVMISACTNVATTNTNTTKTTSTVTVSIFENCTKNNDYANQKHWCYSAVLSNYDSITVCDVLSSNEKDFCYKEFNVAHRGYGQCDKINNQTWKDECYWYYANGKDYTQCLLINSADVRSWCLRDVGIGTNSTTTCDMITDVTELVRCYEEIARQKGDITLCDSISNKINYAPERDNCLMLVAIDTGNENICDLLSNKNQSAINTCKAGARHLV